MSGGAPSGGARRGRGLGVVALLGTLVGCAARTPPPATVSHVDLPRFMGDWYVLAHLPTRAERDAYDALEQYRLREDGSIDIRFTFREGGFDGEREVMTMRGTVHDEETRAEWRVRPFWPLSLDYLVLYVGPEYRTTIIGHPSRDYAWIMARTPTIPEEEYRDLVAHLAEEGYPVGALRRVPQSGRNPTSDR